MSRSCMCAQELDSYFCVRISGYYYSAQQKNILALVGVVATD